MEDYEPRIKKLKTDILDAFSKLKLDYTEDQLKLLTAKTKSADFWSDNLGAQEIMKQIHDDEQKLSPWLKLRDKLTELEDWMDTQGTESNEIIESLLTESEDEYQHLKLSLIHI